ncbi:hypothetical protein [Duffyella gerundensis]|uniref:hypothetical protein n=1 Tax=Duffyella TaxID=3026546 RepID=UPI003F6DD477
MDNMWLKFLGYLIPVAAIVITVFNSLHTRLKYFNNERISVYKDIISLCEYAKLKPYQISFINRDIEKFILIETTKYRDVDKGRLFQKIISSNSWLTDLNIRDIRKVIKCIDEDVIINNSERIESSFILNSKKFKKQSTLKSSMVLVTISIYFLMYFMLSSSIEHKQYILSSIFALASIGSLIAFTIALVNCPFILSRNHYKNLVDSLSNFNSDDF